MAGIRRRRRIAATTDRLLARRRSINYKEYLNHCSRLKSQQVCSMQTGMTEIGIRRQRATLSLHINRSSCIQLRRPALIWNAMPLNICNSPSVSSFKCNLKTISPPLFNLRHLPLVTARASDSTHRQTFCASCKFLYVCTTYVCIQLNAQLPRCLSASLNFLFILDRRSLAVFLISSSAFVAIVLSHLTAS